MRICHVRNIGTYPILDLRHEMDVERTLDGRLPVIPDRSLVWSRIWVIPNEFPLVSLPEHLPGSIQRLYFQHHMSRTDIVPDRRKVSCRIGGLERPFPTPQFFLDCESVGSCPGHRCEIECRSIHELLRESVPARIPTLRSRSDRLQILQCSLVVQAAEKALVLEDQLPYPAIVPDDRIAVTFDQQGTPELLFHVDSVVHVDIHQPPVMESGYVLEYGVAHYHMFHSEAVQDHVEGVGLYRTVLLLVHDKSPVPNRTI